MNRLRIVFGTRSSTSRGFSLIEAAISTVIVGGLLVAALNTVAQSARGLQRTGDRARGTMLAQQLMAEILLQDYEEPVDTPEFGRETSESGGERADYDDVDDYDSWSSSPPEYKDGTEIPDTEGWRRTVSVQRVTSGNLLTPSGTETGIKTIAVRVSYNAVPVAELVSVRTGAGSELFRIDMPQGQ